MNRSLRYWALLGVTCALCVGATSAGAGGEVTAKLKRKINVMEKIIDEVMKESPYLLIHTGDPAHGLYLDEFGVLFTVEASLVSEDFLDIDRLSFLNGLRDVRIESDGDRIIIIPDDEDTDEDDEETSDEGLTIEELRDRHNLREVQRYERGKEELIDTLIDYGEALTELRDDQWVALAAFLEGHDFFRTNEMSRLLMKVKMKDLRRIARDDLSLEEARRLVVVEEY